MLEYLEKLRAKPPKTKKKIAFLVAFFVAGIIFIFWLAVIYPDFKRRQSQIESATSSSTSPLSHFQQVFSDSIYSIGEQIGEIRKSVSSMMSSPEYYSSTTTSTTTTSHSFIEQ